MGLDGNKGRTEAYRYMIVLVTGGREYKNRDLVFQTLDEIHALTPVTLLIEGGAGGADDHARAWAYSRLVHYETFYARWNLDGVKNAGPMRNQRMCNHARENAVKHVGGALTVAFPGDRGTRDCVRRARHAGLHVKMVDEPQRKLF